MKILQTAMLSAVCIVLWGCNRSAPPSKLATLDSTTLQQILKNVEQKVPELEFNPSVLSTSWRGEATAQASFVLRGDKKSLPTVPNERIEVDITRYASSEEAEKALAESLRHRQAAEPSKKSYHGAWLYQYTYGGENTICQAEQYIIEIAPRTNDTKPFIMKILDSILAELSSAPRY